MTEDLKTILGRNVGEAATTNSSDDESQRMNEALSRFAREATDVTMEDLATMQLPTPLPPVAQQLSSDERTELEQFRAMFGRLRLAPSSLYASPEQPTTFTSELPSTLHVLPPIAPV